jgi:hypothetical protein
MWVAKPLGERLFASDPIYGTAAERRPIPTLYG